MDEETTTGERRKGWDFVLVQLDYIRRDLDEVKASLKEMEQGYITVKEFEQRVGRLEKFAYGIIGFMAIGIGGAVLTLILK